MIQITKNVLLAVCPEGRADIIAGLALYLGPAMASKSIDTPLRMAHFIAQAAEETDGFRTLVEYASGAAYEGRVDLGNIYPGDGERTKGRGIFQITGENNYRLYGQVLGINLLAEPSLAAAPEVACLIAVAYWDRHHLNAFADANDIRGITRRINGGLNGLATRQLYFARAWRVVKGCVPSGAAPAALPASPQAKTVQTTGSAVIAVGGGLAAAAQTVPPTWGMTWPMEGAGIAIVVLIVGLAVWEVAHEFHKVKP